MRVTGTFRLRLLAALVAAACPLSATASPVSSFILASSTLLHDKAAGNASKKTGSKMTYLVGDREASCKDEAELMQSEARIRAIVEAAAKVYASSAS